MPEIKINDYIYAYKDTPEVRQKIMDRILAYVRKYGATAGEVIHQDDNCIIYAPEVLSDIVDNILKVKPVDGRE